MIILRSTGPGDLDAAVEQVGRAAGAHRPVALAHARGLGEEVEALARVEARLHARARVASSSRRRAAAKRRGRASATNASASGVSTALVLRPRRARAISDAEGDGISVRGMGSSRSSQCRLNASRRYTRQHLRSCDSGQQSASEFELSSVSRQASVTVLSNLSTCCKASAMTDAQRVRRVDVERGRPMAEASAARREGPGAAAAREPHPGAARRAARRSRRAT